MKSRVAALLLLSLASGAPAAAQSAPPASTTAPPVPTPPQAAAPAETAPTRPDAARLAAAQRLIEILMPPGSMRGFMDDFMPDDDTMLALVAERLGIDTANMTREQRVRAVEERGVREDRQFRERFRLMMEVTRRVTSEVMAELEPEIRGVMVTLLARQFSAAEFVELEAFFRTPVGERYARSSLTMMRDPAWQEFYTLMAPRFTEMQRRLQTEMNAATAHLDPVPHS